jgi:hypothetical protein
MRKLVFVLAALVASIGVAAAAATAPADPGNGAVVINDLGCFVFLPPVSGTTTDSHTVVTPSGNTVLICHFDLANPTGQALVFENFGCSTLIGGTNDSKFVLSASGKGTLTCHINGQT